MDVNIYFNSYCDHDFKKFVLLPTVAFITSIHVQWEVVFEWGFWCIYINKKRFIRDT